MSNYTPGPWGCGKTPAGWYEVFPKQHNLICLATRIDLEADAYIIAAAPEMVDLLENAAVALNNATPHIADKQCREDMLWLSASIYTFLSRFRLSKEGAE